MIEKTEKEIMLNWARNKAKPLVSITCVTFNHEWCIESTLDSLLMQETLFSFEILVHDDASTDSTQDILKSYEKKFPNIVKPIYQAVNQYSKGVNTMTNMFSKVEGEYIAFCDGDDYWCDKNKLELQVNEMKNHPKLDMSFHSAYKLINEKKEEILASHAITNKVFTAQEIILGGGEFCPTSSLIFHRRVLLRIPDWMYTAPIGDYFMQIIGSLAGGALYLQHPMSVYRVGEKDSWSCLSLKDSKRQKKNLLFNNSSLEAINKEYDNEFISEVKDIILNTSLAFIKRRTVESSVKKEIFSIYKDRFSIKEKLLWYLLYKNQNLHNILSKLKPRLTD